MAGMGPAPKDPRRRARTNSDPIPTTVLRFEQAEQPPLPKAPGWLKTWPAQTKRWWTLWGGSAQAEHFTATDWDFLLDTAVLHAAVWGEGEVRHLPELRLRVAKFGATMEDRARLRMQFAQADDADAKRIIVPSSRERFGDLRMLPSATG